MPMTKPTSKATVVFWLVVGVMLTTAAVLLHGAVKRHEPSDPAVHMCKPPSIMVSVAVFGNVSADRIGVTALDIQNTGTQEFEVNGRQSITKNGLTAMYVCLTIPAHMQEEHPQ